MTQKISFTHRRLLPHEITLMKQRLEEFLTIQAEQGRLLGEAMDQSSETWHDNAPAEALSDASRTLAARAEYYIRLMRDAQVCNYPAATDPAITLGSTVTFTLDGKQQTRAIIGELPLYTAKHEYISEDSPLAQAILGRQAGDHIEATLGNRLRHLKIVSLDQAKLAQAFS